MPNHNRDFLTLLRSRQTMLKNREADTKGITLVIILEPEELSAGVANIEIMALGVWSL
ncbi:MAG: hypothetical protein JWR44_2748 [Hymenobacter sp.]|jgi:hypothetical protein|nr:hypothetical protein [Hymenobacter sp.]